MRALLANKFFFRNGGSEAVMFQERNFLLKSGFDVVDFAMQDRRNLPSAYANYFVENQSYTGAPSGARAKLDAALKLIHSREAVTKIGALIDDTEPDIVHCHNIYHQLTPSIIGAAKQRGVPVVLTLHDYKPACPVYTRLRDGKTCSACLDNRFSNVLRYRCAEGSLAKSAILFAEAKAQRWMRSYEKVDMFIAPSEFMRASVTQKRLNPDKVKVIYNGIDCHATEMAAGDAGYILYLGRLSAEKGVETLLHAHARMADPAPLRIAGTGPLEQDLRSRYAQAEFLGHLTGTELEQTIRDAAVIVIPSEWYENCPMSVLEAMAYGKAVVAANIGGIPELVDDEHTGLLFAPGDADALQRQLTRLIQDPELRRRLGDAGRARVESHFSLHHHNTELLNLYHSVIDGSREAQASRRATPVFAPPKE